MKKIVIFLETEEKLWGSELLPYNFIPRNKANKRNNLLTLNVLNRVV